MICVRKYGPSDLSTWDQFVKTSRNASFLFERGFMDYHKARFVDHSLMFFSGNKLVAVLPANRDEDVLISHDGLTYGGLALSNDCTTQMVLDSIEALLQYCREVKLKQVVYKPIPRFYERYPSEEPLYALTRNGAELFRRDIGYVIYLNGRLPMSRDRRYRTNKSKRMGLTFEPNFKSDDFMNIVRRNLRTRHDVNPVHTSADIDLLMRRFPEKCKLICVWKGETLVAGCVVFITPEVVHTQYLHASEEGRSLCAVEALVAHLLDFYCKGKRYLSFGISTEENGTVLNAGLTSFKEGFGARGVVQDFYRIKV